MTLYDIFDLFVREGMAVDPRGRRAVLQKLKKAKESYRKLSGPKRLLFDKGTLSNPYPDSAILCGDAQGSIKNILVGIDIEVGELLLADALRQRGRRIDLVLAHHPEGIALAGLDEVMILQEDVLQSLGVSPKVARTLIEERRQEVCRRLHAANHQRTVDAARWLNFPFMCCHTPADNHVQSYLQRLFEKKRPKSLQAVVDVLLHEAEYRQAASVKAGPRILIGKPGDAPGKIVVDMTGGTEGSKKVFARLSQAGVDTLVVMHLSEEHYLRIKPEHINVIVAGHMASDNLGMNLLLDKLEQRGHFEILECSGFKRVKR